MGTSPFDLPGASFSVGLNRIAFHRGSEFGNVLTDAFSRLRGLTDEYVRWRTKANYLVKKYCKILTWLKSNDCKMQSNLMHSGMKATA